MKNKTIFSLTILTLLLFLGFNLNSLDIQATSSGSFQEDFDNTSYMDSSNSNVSLWGSGHIELPRKNPLYQDLLKVSTTGNSIFVDGNYAYLGGSYDGMYILDITSPDALTLEGYYNDSAEINWIYACVVRDDIAYLANAGDGLLILNVTDKAAPTKLGEIDLYHGLDVALKGNYAYVAAYTGGIRAIDISNPLSPSDVSGYVPVSSGDANGVAISNDLLFVAVSSGGLDVFNISTPTTPVFISNVDLNGYAKKVEIKNNYAYVAADLGGFQIVDISDPTNMTRVAWLDDNTRYFGVDIDGNYVYVAGRSGSSDHKMKIYDISNPEDPVPAGIYNLPQVGHDVFVAGDYVYVVASSAGVLSLRIADTGGHFGGLYGHYAEALSNIIYFAPAGETLERAFLYPTRTIDPDTSIVYYLSADGGTNWESVSPGIEHYFVNTGQMLKWKADLSTTLGTTTPILYNVSVVYYTEDVGIDLLYPGDGTYIQDQMPNFDWNDVPGVMGYQLQVAESTSFHTLLVNESLIMHESNYTLVTPLDYFGQYYWRVAFYIDSNTLSVFSAYSSFTIDDEPVVNEFGKLNTILILVSCLAISSAIIFYKRRKA